MGRVGVLLLNLGGPEQLKDVRPFLYNLFADPEILRLPFAWMQKPFAGFISTLRARTSRDNYRQIGGGSPLRRITEAQAHALQDDLQAKGCDAQVYIGMRYWHPFTEEAVARIKRDGIEELVILPLYPQFSISTSGSSIRLLEKIWSEDPELQKIKYTVISSWHDRPGYVQVMADFLRQELDQFANPEQTTVFFSAHGVPLSYVTESGDPYQQEIEASTQLIMEALERPNPHILAYQSRVGPMEWLRPYTTNVIAHLGQQGVKDLVVVPISFISEHIETLQEIDMEYRHLALESGIENFRRMPAVNIHPDFIDTLSEMVLEYLDKPSLRFSQVFRPQKKIKLYPQERWEWGMTTTAERWNGRFAMVGFIALLVELISGYGPLHLAGLL
ncbi:ferrochelatase [Acaryochloris sp. 'Moss Beach']|uniref:ferrochelatase n=1 Tax=Acaryochloris TaxID=155977 RepID=UPI001BAEC786|nr:MULTISPECIES: ferrochelatase [Acaryochloris]QUY41738.1 ferrochelatase [Acaryochloris marina S15]UJB70893.1 ferrochelatase [Acaryochloris sp. 'Moss Beach']